MKTSIKNTCKDVSAMAMHAVDVQSNFMFDDAIEITKFRLQALPSW